MKSTSKSKEKHHKLKEESRLQKSINSRFFYLTCIPLLVTIFSLHLIFNHNKTINFNPTNSYIQPNKETIRSSAEMEGCDLFKGRWIHDPNATVYYTNYTCSTMPYMRNCFFHGRKDKDFLNWKWKPDQCELPRFDAVSFLSILRGKKMAFIGDSLARNQMDSLLCLLSTVETPKSMEKDQDDKNAAWEFPEHNFTLTVFWSPFLMAATEIVLNGTTTGSFHLHLDKPDPTWSEKLPSVNYAVFSAAHWFPRPHYLHEGGNLTGCIYCQARNITCFGPGPIIRRAFRVALRAVNECKSCTKIVSFLQTYSPEHFENGTWMTGGTCNRAWPIGLHEVDRAQPRWEYRKIQVEEMERARSEGEGRQHGFEAVDVTEMMSTRADGHPGIHWGNLWMKGSSDCLHWCMPGPVDTWNELMLEMIKRRNKISS